MYCCLNYCHTALQVYIICTGLVCILYNYTHCTVADVPPRRGGGACNYVNRSITARDHPATEAGARMLFSTPSWFFIIVITYFFLV